MKSILILSVALAGALAGCRTAAKPDYDTLIAHRGESVDAPENTLPAYRMAVERGFGFECDIYLSKDGRVFTFHDSNLKRTSGGACTSRCDQATWAMLSKLDVGGWGKWKGSQFAGTRPALLEEVLALARDGRQIYIEVKPGPSIVPFVKAALAAQSKASPKNVLFISFNKSSCAELKKQLPEYKVYWLTGATKGLTAARILKALRETGADGVDCQFSRDVVTAEMISSVRDAGYEFHVWTVDNLADAEEAFKRGAQTVTTNRAKGLLDEYAKKGK